MIMVKGEIDGKKYKEPFSKGVLARSLTIADMGSKKAYNLARKIELKLIENKISAISIEDLVELIIEFLEQEDPVVAEKYKKWRKIRRSNEPLIILIGGASGIGTSSIAFELASRLGIKNMISTDMIREVMRKIVSKDLSPVIHESSFNAYKGVRSPSLTVDPVVEGYIDHVDVVTVGIEAVIERALKEGISIIIEGVHLVPGFINDDLINKYNVIMFTLTLHDEEIHKGRFYSRCRQLWARRPLQVYLDNFDSIRKTHDFLIDQAKIKNSILIENIDVTQTVDIMINDIIEKYGGIINDKQESERNNDK